MAKCVNFCLSERLLVFPLAVPICLNSSDPREQKNSNVKIDAHEKPIYKSRRILYLSSLFLSVPIVLGLAGLVVFVSGTEK